MPTEQTPLLWNGNFARTRGIGDDVHAQFCSLSGCPPSNAPAGYKHNINTKSIYGRAKAGLHSQQNTYYFTAALTNTLLLSQVVLGAALTALGAAKVPYIMVTIFGAANTVIAGLVAYLKSRGQPMRSRMYRDDLERVVEEIENSEVMWLGISQDVDGYHDLLTGKDPVTVRDEVARLTRLYDRAVRTNNLNSPDLYAAGGPDPSGTNKPNPSSGTAGTTQQPAKPKDQTEPSPTGTGAQDTTAAPQNSTPTPATQPATDPEASPASAAPEHKKTDETNNKPVSTDPDKDQPAAARESDLEAKDKDKTKDSTTPVATTDPSSSTPTKDTSTANKTDMTKASADSGTGSGSGSGSLTSTTAPATAPTTSDATPTSSVAPISMADVDQSPATRPRVSSSNGAGQKDSKGTTNLSSAGVAKKVAGD